jgi:hypothetical protein
MNSRSLSQAASAPRLDLNTLKRAFFYVAIALLFVAPFSQDPMAFAVGAAVPWVLLQIAVRPGLPVAVVFFLLWQWLQTFARVLQSMVDGESLANGLYGPAVGRAYWYMLASLIVLALAARLVLGRLRPPTIEDRRICFEWRPLDLFTLYLGALFVSVVFRYGSMFVPALEQPLDAAAKLKAVTLFMLFVTAMMTKRGGNLVLGAFAAELVLGFSGMQSDFRSVFLYVGLAALAARVQLKGTTVAIGAVAAGFLIFLALFWTSVKAEYREFATASSDSQNIRVALDDRFGYLGNRIASSADMDWQFASYTLLSRLAYTDIFGSVIGVQETAPELVFVRQWQDAFDHVFKPRFLFPDKAALSDTEVYIRLARGDSSEQMRLGTSISVGYIAENFVDFGFPGMLIGIFVLGVVYCLVIRYFMSLRQLPWLLREAIIVGFVANTAINGVEISLPKMLGAIIMYFLVFALISRFALPTVLGWLRGRSDFRPQHS